MQQIHSANVKKSYDGVPLCQRKYDAIRWRILISMGLSREMRNNIEKIIIGA
ncbi:MAG TPA: hypothetical protein VIA09_04345 [Nitrososphaeraceae archaeon]